jgi:hypothetical protein
MRKVVKKSVNSAFKSALKYGSRQLYLHQRVVGLQEQKGHRQFPDKQHQWKTKRGSLLQNTSIVLAGKVSLISARQSDIIYTI